MIKVHITFAEPPRVSFTFLKVPRDSTPPYSVDRNLEVGDFDYNTIIYNPTVYFYFHDQTLILYADTALLNSLQNLQIPLLLFCLIALNLIPYLEIAPAFEADTALTPLAHLCDVFLDVFERLQGS
jgi:hypothetical protein